MEARTEEIKIEDIRITERIRKEVGDLESLAASVRERGLINPVTVMEMSDGGYLLLAGARRISACKSLGWEDIRATVVPVVDAEEQLRIEVAENEERKEFTVGEKLEFAEMFTEIEHEKARQRMAKYGRLGGLGGKDAVDRNSDSETAADDNKGVAKWPHPSKGRVRDIVAEKSGFTSSTQMRRAKEIAEKRPDLLEKIDSRELSIGTAHRIAVGTANHGTSAQVVPQPVFRDTLPDISESTGADTTQQPVPAMPEAAEEAIYGEAQPMVSMPQYAGIPKQPGEILMAKLTPEEKRRARKIEGALVREREFTIDTEIPDMFRPADYDTHERLMAEPMYAELFEHDRKLQGVANLIRGELVTKCENYEKRIRSYEENIQAMRRQIEMLQARLAEGHTDDSTESEDEVL